MIFLFLIFKEMAACLPDGRNNFCKGLLKEVSFSSAAKRAGMHFGLGVDIEVTVSCPHTTNFALVVSKEIHNWKLLKAWISI